MQLLSICTKDKIQKDFKCRDVNSGCNKRKACEVQRGLFVSELGTWGWSIGWLWVGSKITSSECGLGE